MEEGGGQGAPEGLPGPPSHADDAIGDEEDEFSFPVSADACVVPVYPVFGRLSSPPPAVKEGEEEEEEPETATLRVPLGRLLLEEREFRARQSDGRSASARTARRPEGDEASAGGDDELDGVPPESYCLWAPGGESAPASPRRCRKSGSTGSVLRWRRISERLVGRSHSDGKEKFVFLAAPHGPEPPPTPNIINREQDEGGGGSKGAAAGGAALRYYGRGGGAGSRRRSYLPYKQELVGLFADVRGLRRSYHPF